jgi:flagellar biosynthesis component FlhA
MATTLAILMVLGIFVGIPAVIGFTLAGIYVLAGRRAQKTEQKTEAAAKAHVLIA